MTNTPRREMTMTMITDDHIEQLATEAGAAGDLETVHLCHAALEGDKDARDEVGACILWAREMAAEGGEHE